MLIFFKDSFSHTRLKGLFPAYITMVANTASDTTAATPQLESTMSNLTYWCHECTMNVSTTFNIESNEVECQSCGGCFVEEIEDDTTTEGRPQDFVIPVNEPIEQDMSENVDFFPSLVDNGLVSSLPGTVEGSQVISSLSRWRNIDLLGTGQSYRKSKPGVTNPYHS